MERFTTSMEKLSAAAGQARDRGMNAVFTAEDAVSERVRQIAHPDSYFGIDFETEMLRNPVFYLGIPGIIAWEAVLKTEVKAPELPKSGPLLVISNHPNFSSTVHGPYAIAMATGNRLPIETPKTSLVDPSYQESKKVVERTGKRGDIFSGYVMPDNPTLGDRTKHIAYGITRRVTAPAIRRLLETIPVDRDGMKLSTLRSIRQALADGRIVLTFLQDTKTEENSLENMVDFAALIISQNREVPASIMIQRLTGAGSDDEGTLDHPVISMTEAFKFDPKLSREEIHRGIRTRTKRAMHDAGIKKIIDPDFCDKRFEQSSNA